MGQQSKSRHLRFYRNACLFIGIIEATGAVLWSMAGAGMYGSPLMLFFHEGSFKELGFIISIILIGPGIALWAGLCARKLPCRATWMFFIGAALSLILGARYQDMGLLLAVLISLPMCLAALFSLLVCKAEAIEEIGSSPSEAASSKHRLVQFRLWHLMIFVTVLCGVIGLALAHANAALHRPPICSPFLEKLMETKTVPGFVRPNNSAPSLVPIPAGSPYISRLQCWASYDPDGMEMSVMAKFRLDQNFLPKEQRMETNLLIGRLRNEFEKQLIKDGAQILEINISKYELESSIKVPLELHILYRWRRTKGVLEARFEGVNDVEVEIEETPDPSFLRLCW